MNVQDVGALKEYDFVNKSWVFFHRFAPIKLLPDIKEKKGIHCYARIENCNSFIVSVQMWPHYRSTTIVISRAGDSMNCVAFDHTREKCKFWQISKYCRHRDGQIVISVKIFILWNIWTEFFLLWISICDFSLFT